MKMRSAVSLFLAPLAILAFIAASPSPGFAQDTNTDTVKATQVLGLTGVKHNTTGMLTIENGSLKFTKGDIKAEVPATSITEVLQGADTQRTIGGTFGTITQLGPYGSGRFLSLFRTKIDTLSIIYVDAAGGVHGAVFTVSKGKGVPAKRALLAQGAKTSVPIDVGTTTETTAAQKPTGTKP